LRAFHAEISAAAFGDDASLLASCRHRFRKLRTNWICESHVGNHTTPEECVDTMPRAVDKLIGDYELQWLVLFFERSDRGNRKDAIDSQLFKSINVCAEV